MKVVRGFSANWNAVNLRVLYRPVSHVTQLQHILERYGLGMPGISDFIVY